jgi:tRNA(Ile2) C34 agmatinyltransferase TiaS
MSYEHYSQRAPENMEFYRMSWDRSEEGPCNPCSISVDELGNFQCTDCRKMFPKSTESQIISILEQGFGESWAERYKELKKIQGLVEDGASDQLTIHHYAYIDKDGRIKTDRYFCEKRI